MRNHIALMAVYAALTSLFFALLWKEPHERKRFFVKTFATLLLAAVVVGWVMYPFPIR